MAIYGDLESALETWYRVVKRADWKNITDVRQIYPHADAVDGYTVFNIKGNSYRLIVDIKYQWRRVFIKHVLTHKEYDRGGWK